MTQDERVQRYAEAMRWDSLGWDSLGSDFDAVRAVMAVADAEQAELRAEVKATYRDFAEVSAHSASLDHRLRAAERALAVERAKVARVEALVDQWDGEVGAQEDYQHSTAVRAVECCIRDLLAALKGCEHGETPGCCATCEGTGFGSEGMCWDCRGTGHPHPLAGPEPGPVKSD
jgi:hypothetical protein